MTSITISDLLTIIFVLVDDWYQVHGPMICPMIPFLDPGSNIFENPDRYGYRLFYRTVEEHRRGMERASIINRINYETKWLRRQDLVYVGYKAMRQLMDARESVGQVPLSWVANFKRNIDDAVEFNLVFRQK